MSTTVIPSSTNTTTLLPPQSLPPPLTISMAEIKSVPVSSSVEWTSSSLGQYQVVLKTTNQLDTLKLTDDTHIIPKQLLDEKSVEKDLLVQSFLDTLNVVQTMFMRINENVVSYSETYTRQLLYDFMRILLLANKCS